MKVDNLGTYQVTVSAVTDDISASFDTTFDVAEYVDYDIYRQTLSVIDPITNENRFPVVIDIISHTDADEITIIETVPKEFVLETDGTVEIEGERKVITWQKELDDNSTQISYHYTVPLVFPSLYPLGPVTVVDEETEFTEARAWFVANDPPANSTVNLSEYLFLTINSDGSVDSTVEINSSTTNGPTLSEKDNFGRGVANLGDLNNDGVTDVVVGAARDDNGSVWSGAIHLMFFEFRWFN